MPHSLYSFINSNETLIRKRDIFIATIYHYVPLVRYFMRKPHLSHAISILIKSMNTPVRLKHWCPFSDGILYPFSFNQHWWKQWVQMTHVLLYVEFEYDSHRCGLSSIYFILPTKYERWVWYFDRSFYALITRPKYIILCWKLIM